MSNGLLIGSLNRAADSAVVIMAGGQGTRFWPVSRRLNPKQFLPCPDSELSLLEATAKRIKNLWKNSQLIVVTAAEYGEKVSQLLPDAAVLLEPCPRNTAPCAAFAARFILEEIGDVPFVLLPADHLISPASELERVLAKCLVYARDNDALVTLGIKPRVAHPGFGYLKCQLKCQSSSEPKTQEFLPVEAFVEKPAQVLAEEYVKHGGYFWNSGMFAWRPRVFLKALRETLPVVDEQISQLYNTWRDGGCDHDGSKEHAGKENPVEHCPVEHSRRAELDRKIAEIFSSINPVSVDVGVMEKVSNAVMLPVSELEWSDVGSWNSWAECAGLNGDDNLLKGDVLAYKTSRSVVVAPHRLVAVIGVDDLIVIDAADALLVCRRNNAEDVKAVVDELKARGRAELL